MGISLSGSNDLGVGDRGSSGVDVSRDSQGQEDEDENVMTKTVTITLGASAAYMILVIGLMVWCRYRRAKRKALYLQQAAAEGTLCKCLMC